MLPEKPAEQPVRSGRHSAHWSFWLALDLMLILAFAAWGRTSHGNGLDAGGVLLTAAPFAVACLLGWAAIRGWRAPQAIWPSGVVIWLGTAAGGLAIRALFDGGVDVAFQVVTLLVLAIFLLLPRALAATALSVRKSPASPAAPQTTSPANRNQGADT